MDCIAGDDWRISCLARKFRICDAIQNQFSSCKHLVDSTILKIFNWFSFLTCGVGNGIVIFYRLVLYNDHAEKNTIIINLAISDSLMSLYLLGIGIGDSIFQGNYAYQSEKWRHSAICKTLASVASFSSELSLNTLVLLSYFYLRGLVYNRGMLSRRRLLVFLLCFWLVYGILCVFPLMSGGPMLTGSCLFLYYTYRIMRSFLTMYCLLLSIQFYWQYIVLLA